jgi:hypothetical protein
VTLVRFDRKSRDARYQTAHLQPGDFFVLTVLRPGQYLAKIPGEKAEATINVAALKTREGQPFCAGEPARVTAEKATFDPKQIKMNATEGLIFVAQGAERIVLELAKPAEEEPRPKPKPRWTNPRLIWTGQGKPPPSGRAKRAK